MGGQIELRIPQEFETVILHGWFNSEMAFGDYDQPFRFALDELQRTLKDRKWTALRVIAYNGTPVGFADYSVDRKAPWIAGITVIIATATMRGRGIGTVVHRLLAAEIFQLNPDIKKIEAWTDAENMAEQRVLEKAGFLKEGIFQRKWQLRGQLRAMAAYGLLAP